jgi:hypothetical protein
LQFYCVNRSILLYSRQILYRSFRHHRHHRPFTRGSPMQTWRRHSCIHTTTKFSSTVELIKRVLVHLTRAARAGFRKFSMDPGDLEKKKLTIFGNLIFIPKTAPRHCLWQYCVGARYKALGLSSQRSEVRFPGTPKICFWVNAVWTFF